MKSEIALAGFKKLAKAKNLWSSVMFIQVQPRPIPLPSSQFLIRTEL